MRTHREVGYLLRQTALQQHEYLQSYEPQMGVGPHNLLGLLRLMQLSQYAPVPQGSPEVLNDDGVVFTIENYKI